MCGWLYCFQSDVLTICKWIKRCLTMFNIEHWQLHASLPCLFIALSLTLTTLLANSQDDTLIILVLLYFLLKIGFDISCKLSPREIICMKCQSLYLEKKIRKIFQKVVCWIFYTCRALKAFTAWCRLSRQEKHNKQLRVKTCLLNSEGSNKSSYVHNLIIDLFIRWYTSISIHSQSDTWRSWSDCVSRCENGLGLSCLRTPRWPYYIMRYILYAKLAHTQTCASSQHGHWCSSNFYL